MELHKYQVDILKELAHVEHFRFNEMLNVGLSSEHLNYHLKEVIKEGLVEKNEGKYRLTNKGKDYINQLDTDMDILEKQPKVSVIIRGIRKNKEGVFEHLTSKRTIQPYLGKIGRITGKIRFGETAEQTARRELYEETGLTAKNFILEQIYRKIRSNEQGEIVQDVIFHLFLATDFEGDLKKETDVQENFWMTKEELLKADLFDTYKIIESDLPLEFKYIEDIGFAQGY